MSDGNRQTRSGLSLPWVLTIIFCVLQFTGLIDWSWYWLISPIWITVGIVLATVTIIFTAFTITGKIIKKNNDG